MAKNKTAYYTKAGRTATTVVTATSTVFTAGVEGSKILMTKVLELSGTPSLRVFINDGTTDHNITALTASSAGLDILELTLLPKAPNGMRYLNLESGWSIKATNTSGGSTTILVYGEDY